MDLSNQEVKDMVIAAIAKSLACEVDEIRSTASLVDDLGMDSLDFLDVIFSLEKKLQTKLLGGEINKLLRPEKSVAEDSQEPNLTSEEIDKMSPYIPALKKAADNNRKILRLDLYKLVTAETLVAIILHETKNKAS